jgi:hypothetical protein
MRYLLTFALFGIVISGCGRSRSNPPASAPNDPDIANIAPEERVINEATPAAAETHLPVMTAKSPPIILTAVQGDATTPPAPTSLSTENWQTFTSAALGVTLEYPADWSVVEEADGATFTAQNGGTIQMKADTASVNNNEIRIGNQRCTSRTNQYNLTADVCVTTISFLYTAKFTLPQADGSTRWVTLLTETRSVGEVFETMFNSVRPAN